MTAIADAWPELFVAPLWGLVVAVLALLLAWVCRRPLRRIVGDLGVTRLSILGVDLEWVAEQTGSAYSGRGLPAPSRSELRSFARLSAELAPLVSGRRILWVDDVPGGNVAETRLLRGLGVDVENATATTEALERLEKNPARFDLVISDWTRGGAEAGPELLERLRANGFRMPVIFYVGEVTISRRTRAAELGAVTTTALPDELLKYALTELATAP